MWGDRVAGRRHGTRLIVGQGDDAQKAAVLRVARHDEFSGAYECRERCGVREWGHGWKALLAVAVDAIVFQQWNDLLVGGRGGGMDGHAASFVRLGSR